MWFLLAFTLLCSSNVKERFKAIDLPHQSCEKHDNMMIHTDLHCNDKRLFLAYTSHTDFSLDITDYFTIEFS